MSDDRLAHLTLDAMAPFTGRVFTLAATDGTVVRAILVGVLDRSRPDGRHGPAGGRSPFSLTFRPEDGQSHPQQVYEVAGEGFAPLPILCVPVRGDDGAPLLEAVFH